MSVTTISIETIRARKLARLWTALDAQRGSTYIYDAKNMSHRPDIANFGAGRFAAFGSLPRATRAG